MSFFCYRILQFYLSSLVGRGCRIHRLYHCRGVRPPPNECSLDDTKHSDDDVPSLEALQNVEYSLSLPLLPCSLLPGLVAPDRVLSVCQIELFDIQILCKLITYANLNCSN